MFSDILEDLRSLAAANLAADADQVFRRLTRLDAVMQEMARRSARFHVTLGEVVSLPETSLEVFLQYKDALLTHTNGFTAELDRYLPYLDQAVKEVEASGLPALLAFAAHADDRPFLALEARMAEWEQRWQTLRGWFTVSPQARSGVAELRATTRTAVSAVIALLRQWKP